MPRDGPNGRCQRAQAIKRRRQIWGALHPEEIQVGKVCPPESATGYKQPPPQEKGFAASTAAVSGESKRSINQHLARAEALGDDLERITGTRKDFTPSERVEVTCDLITSDALAAGTPARVEGALPAGRHLTIR